MPTIKEVRAKYPQYSDLTDTELADALHGKYYSDIPKDKFYAQVGVKQNLGSDMADPFKRISGAQTRMRRAAVDAVANAAQRRDFLPDVGNVAKEGLGAVLQTFAAPFESAGALVGAGVRATGARPYTQSKRFVRDGKVYEVTESDPVPREVTGRQYGRFERAGDVENRQASNELGTNLVNAALFTVPGEKVTLKTPPKKVKAPTVTPLDRVKGAATAVGEVIRPGGPPRVSGNSEAARMKAAQVVERQARRAGVDPVAAARANSLTTAENIGPGAEAMLTALGRREGATGEALASTLEGRTQAFPQRLEDAFIDTTGLDRTFISGDIEDMARRMRQNAKPLFDQFQNLGPLTSPEMQSILKTPAARNALRDAADEARNLRQSPEDIALIERLANDGLPTGPVSGAGYLPDAQAYVGSANVRQALKRAQGPSLAKFLADRGGLLDSGGDLAAMDAQLFHKSTPFQRRLINPQGQGIDDAAVAAWEAGYFPNMPQAPQASDLMEALRREFSGQPIYARGAGEAGDLANQVGRFDDMVNRLEINPTGKSAAQLADEVANEKALRDSYEAMARGEQMSPMPETYMAEEAVPNARTLYDVKKILDREALQRQIRARKEGAAPGDYGFNRVYGDLREELRRLTNERGFDYDAMVAAGGEAPKLEAAYRKGPGLLDKYDSMMLGREMKGATSSEKQASLAGYVNDLVNNAAAKQNLPPSKLRLMATPDYAKRVEQLAEKPIAGDFQARMADLVRERRGMRMMPRTNSVTGEINAANRDIDAMSGVMSGRVPRGWGELVNRMVEPYIDAIASGFQAPFAPELRDELGRMLIDPQYFQESLAALNRYRSQVGQPQLLEIDLRNIARFAVGGALPDAVNVPQYLGRAAAEPQDQGKSGPPRKSGSQRSTEGPPRKQ